MVYGMLSTLGLKFVLTLTTQWANSQTSFMNSVRAIDERRWYWFCKYKSFLFTIQLVNKNCLCATLRRRSCSNTKYTYV